MTERTWWRRRILPEAVVAATRKGSESISRWRSRERGNRDYYDADGLGSVTSLPSTAGALAQTYKFDSFGKQTASSGSLTNPFQYTGRELDPETSLYYYRARYYDPRTQEGSSARSRLHCAAEMQTSRKPQTGTREEIAGGGLLRNG